MITCRFHAAVFLRLKCRVRHSFQWGNNRIQKLDSNAKILMYWFQTKGYQKGAQVRSTLWLICHIDLS